jgi:uncharacterized protein
VELQERHADGRQVTNTLQTNGTLLTDAWCEFLSEHGFLVGLSVDGPSDLHDAYRVDKGGKPTFRKVMAGLELLKKHGVEFNTLTVVNRRNSRHPLRVYRFLKEIGSTFHQFIPLVERGADARARALSLALAGPPDLPAEGRREDGNAGRLPPAPGTAGEPRDPEEIPEGEAGPPVTPWSVESRQWGAFLVAIFDEWVREDVGRIFVQTFDAALGKWVGVERGLCVFEETCGDAMALEHNGDLYACDHFVYPEFNLGNILQSPLVELASGPRQTRFGKDKRDRLPQYCLECEVRFACNGECPKNRFISTPGGEPGLNYLCAGYRRFFNHVRPHMEIMAELLQRRRAPAEIMAILAARETQQAMRSAGRNDPCPCGSGKKFKNCCGRA